MIYMGPADKALPFFLSSPSLTFSMNDYNNAADFLSDVSGCLLRNDKVSAGTRRPCATFTIINMVCVYVWCTGDGCGLANTGESL